MNEFLSKAGAGNELFFFFEHEIFGRAISDTLHRLIGGQTLGPDMGSSLFGRQKSMWDMPEKDDVVTELHFPFIGKCPYGNVFSTLFN